jgi:PilZ domain
LTAPAPATPAAELRRRYRHRLHDVAYVNIDHGNGGILLDLSETGVALQAVAPLRLNQPVRLRVELQSPRLALEATGRVRWANGLGEAGVEFPTLPRPSQRLVRDWLLTQLLQRAQPVADRDSIFRDHLPASVPPAVPVPAVSPAPIPVATREARHPDPPKHGVVRLLSWPGLARCIDAVIILDAVLLFAVVSLLLTQAVPQWPVSTGLAAGVTCIFAIAYRWMFVGKLGTTAGAHLARIANTERKVALEREPDQRPRFR